jgi:hypothetical protein
MFLPFRSGLEYKGTENRLRSCYTVPYSFDNKLEHSLSLSSLQKSWGERWRGLGGMGHGLYLSKNKTCNFEVWQHENWHRLPKPSVNLERQPVAHGKQVPVPYRTFQYQGTQYVKSVLRIRDVYPVS